MHNVGAVNNPRPMRTTLAIDDDVLCAAKAMAERQQMTLGQAISSLARQGLRRADQGAVSLRNGVPLLRAPGPAQPVTLQLVNTLRDELL